MVFTVAWTFTPCRWAKSTARGSSSSLKFPAKDRMPKDVPARYTASAPYSTAICSFSQSPAGASNSGFFRSAVIRTSADWRCARTGCG